MFAGRRVQKEHAPSEKHAAAKLEKCKPGYVQLMTGTECHQSHTLRSPWAFGGLQRVKEAGMGGR